jgi:hypothetical protein
MQAIYEPCNVSFVQKYGVDAPVNHVLYIVPLVL